MDFMSRLSGMKIRKAKRSLSSLLAMVLLTIGGTLFAQDDPIITPAEAAESIRTLGEEGLFHSIWTFRTPYIGAVCNCDQDCIAYRVSYSRGYYQIMFRGEYIAKVDFDALSELATADEIDRIRRCRVEMPQIDLSSTEIRRRVGQGLSIRYQTPRAVEKYIQTHQLYR